MRRVVAVMLSCSLVGPAAALAVGKDKALYVGGTVGLVPRSEGVLYTSDAERIRFVGTTGTWETPWETIEELEYGQKAGRRARDYALIGLGAFLFKKRQHFLTIAYRDAEGKDQAAIFELGKDVVRATLTVAETRSGRKVTYQDEEAARSRSN
jgi:hypothetical protein